MRQGFECAIRDNSRGAFPLSTFCMRPYAQSNLSDSKRIFGYQLSRGRRTTENASSPVAVT